MLALLTVPVVLVTEIRVLEALVAIVAAASILGRGRWRWASAHKLNRPFDQLVQLASVQPDPSAAWAVVDLDALTFGHDEFNGLANRTQHGSAFLRKSSVVQGIVRSRSYRFLSAHLPFNAPSCPATTSIVYSGVHRSEAAPRAADNSVGSLTLLNFG